MAGFSLCAHGLFGVNVNERRTDHYSNVAMSLLMLPKCGRDHDSIARAEPQGLVLVAKRDLRHGFAGRYIRICERLEARK